MAINQGLFDPNVDGFVPSGAQTRMPAQSPEMMSIALDMIGKNLAPSNPFAGVGTAMAQSKLASQKAQELRQQDKGFWEQLVKSLSAPESPGNTSMNVTYGKDGLEYTMKGNGSDMGSLKTQTPTPAPTFDNLNMDSLIKRLGGFEVPTPS